MAGLLEPAEQAQWQQGNDAPGAHHAGRGVQSGTRNSQSVCHCAGWSAPASFTRGSGAAARRICLLRCAAPGVASAGRLPKRTCRYFRPGKCPLRRRSRSRAGEPAYLLVQSQVREGTCSVTRGQPFRAIPPAPVFSTGAVEVYLRWSGHGDQKKDAHFFCAPCPDHFTLTIGAS